MDSNPSFSSGKRRKWRRSKYGNKYAKYYKHRAKYSKYAKNASEPPYLKIAEVIGERPRYINVRGKVIYNSEVRPWENVDNVEGKIICFDIRDDSGTIRVYAWNDIAVYAGERVKRNKTVEIRNVAVGPRKPQFNNLEHRFELTMFQKSEIVDLNFPIEVIDEKIRYVSFEDVPSFAENVYFSVTGRVTEIGAPSSGFGQERGNPYNKQTFDLVDEKGIHLKVVSWNREIPVTEDFDGKTIAIIRCKHKYGCIDPSNAYIILDGQQLK